MLRSLIFASLLGLICLGVIACDEDGPTEVVSYDITIVNNDSVEYELWIDADVDVEEYVRDGVVEANSARVLRDRTIAVRYDMRLVTPGQNPNLPDEEFVYEESIMSNGPDITWTVPEVLAP